MAAGKNLSDTQKMQDLIKGTIAKKAPNMVKKALEYCEKYFDSPDIDKSKLAHKIYDKMFGKIVPDVKILKVEEAVPLPPQFQRIAAQIASEAMREIDAEFTVLPVDAKLIRDSTRK